MRTTDPARMSPDAIVAEVGELLAAGIQRYLHTKCDVAESTKNAPDPLDATGKVEAPCDATPEPPE